MNKTLASAYFSMTCLASVGTAYAATVIPFTFGEAGNAFQAQFVNTSGPLNSQASASTRGSGTKIVQGGLGATQGGLGATQGGLGATQGGLGASQGGTGGASRFGGGTAAATATGLSSQGAGFTSGTGMGLSSQGAGFTSGTGMGLSSQGAGFTSGTGSGLSSQGAGFTSGTGSGLSSQGAGFSSGTGMGLSSQGAGFGMGSGTAGGTSTGAGRLALMLQGNVNEPSINTAGAGAVFTGLNVSAPLFVGPLTGFSMDVSGTMNNKFGPFVVVDFISGQSTQLQTQIAPITQGTQSSAADGFTNVSFTSDQLGLPPGSTINRMGVVVFRQGQVLLDNFMLNNVPLDKQVIPAETNQFPF